MNLRSNMKAVRLAKLNRVMEDILDSEEGDELHMAISDNGIRGVEEIIESSNSDIGNLQYTDVITKKSHLLQIH